MVKRRTVNGVVDKLVDKVDEYKNRITRHDVVLASALDANPANWRTHPKVQQDALNGLLKEVGWVQDVIINERTGLIVDGHLRVQLAAGRGEAIPVVYVDLSPEEESIVLATLDPIGAMAGRDDEAFAALVHDLTVGDQSLAALLMVKVPTDDTESDFDYQEKYGVTIICPNAEAQETLYNELNGRGYECKVVVV